MESKVHYHVHKNPPLTPVLNQIHSVHSFQPSFPKIYSNINVSWMSCSSELSVPFRFYIKLFYAYLISPMCAACPTHLILLYLITLIISGEIYTLCSSPFPRVVTRE
jgi:hypothetical protein